MAKIGYIMVPKGNESFEEDKIWMKEFGCSHIYEEKYMNEQSRPLWKQLMLTLNKGDELVISKLSNALRGTRELAIFLNLCRTKSIRLIAIQDKIDSNNILFPETTVADVLNTISELPHQSALLRKATPHRIKLSKQKPEKMTTREIRYASRKERLANVQTIINMYKAGHKLEDIMKIGKYCSRSTIYRILHKNGIPIHREMNARPSRKEK